MYLKLYCICLALRVVLQVVAALTTGGASPVAAAAAVQPPAQFLCPLTLNIMRKPVLASDGHTCRAISLEHGRFCAVCGMQQTLLSP